MANVLIFDKISRKVLRYIKSAHTPDFANRDDVLINPDISGIDLSFSKVDVDNNIINMSAEEKLDIINQQKLDNYAQLRAQEYPKIGDQLDTILKQFDELSVSGALTILPEMQSLISNWKQVKQKYPKP